MAFLQVQFFSDVLNVASTVNVILPEGSQGIGVEASADNALPRVLYLLHGYSDDHSIWMRRTSVERYAAASCSGAVNVIRELDDSPAVRREKWQNVLGDLSKVPGSEVDLLYLMKKNASAPKKPRLYVSCGTADFLYGQHQFFVPALEKHGWPVTRYDEPGVGHEWAFWARQIKTFIEMIFEVK